MTCTDPEYGISALVSQAPFCGGNKWCHPEMSAISGLINSNSRTKDSIPASSFGARNASDTRVTDNEAQGTMGRRKMGARETSWYEADSMLYISLHKY